MDIAEKISHSGKLITCTEPDFRDIDSDQKDPQLCSIYAIDIYRNLSVAEVCTTTRTLSHFNSHFYAEFCSDSISPAHAKAAFYFYGNCTARHHSEYAGDSG